MFAISTRMIMIEGERNVLIREFPKRKDGTWTDLSFGLSQSCVVSIRSAAGGKRVARTAIAETRSNERRQSCWRARRENTGAQLTFLMSASDWPLHRERRALGIGVCSQTARTMKVDVERVSDCQSKSAEEGTRGAMVRTNGWMSRKSNRRSHRLRPVQTEKAIRSGMGRRCELF
jgi:hypothetical protein